MIQSVLFEKKKYSIPEAMKYLTDNGLKSNKLDATDKYYRFRQTAPRKNMDYITKKTKNGVLHIIGSSLMKGGALPPNLIFGYSYLDNIPDAPRSIQVRVVNNQAEFEIFRNNITNYLGDETIAIIVPITYIDGRTGGDIFFMEASDLLNAISLLPNIQLNSQTIRIFLQGLNFQNHHIDIINNQTEMARYLREQLEEEIGPLEDIDISESEMD